MASLPFEFDCVKEAGFVMDPNEHQRVGYITALEGFDRPLPSDLTVFCPFTKPTYAPLGDHLVNGKANVIGVIEKFSWLGGVGDPINIDFYVSQENAAQIKALQQMTLKTTIKSLGWWIGNYDQEAKVWYEQSYPMSPVITGVIQGQENPNLDVDLNPIVVKDGVDVNVYKVSLKVVPAENLQYTLSFANSSKESVVKSWGLIVGTLAKSEGSPE